MKITLTFNELEAIKKVANSIDNAGAKELVNAFKNNNILTCNVDLFNQKVTVNIKEEYLTDYLDVYGKFINLFVLQVKAMTDTAMLFVAETEEVVKKHNR